MFVPAVRFRIVLGAFALAAVPWAFGQNDEPARPSYSRMLNIDALLDNHVRFLARRYNLSADQEAYTQTYLHAKTDQFLERHREQLFDLIDRLVDVRAGAEMSPQELIAWGKQALPLYQEAKTLILEGNNEWRTTLTEEQHKVHDEDLRDMYTSFTTTEDQLQRITAGQMTLEEFRRGPGRNVPRLDPTPVPMTPGAASPTKPRGTNTNTAESTAPPAPKPAAPPAPAKSPTTPPANPGGPSQGATPPPKPGKPTPPPSADQADARAPRTPRGDTPAPPKAGRNVPGGSTKTGTGSDFESQWEAYVREFIQKYQLDEAQTQRANSILKDCQEQARSIFDKRKADLERIDKKLQSLAETKEGPEKLKELNELNEQRVKLLAPLDEIFERQLKPRLEKLPTRTQRQAAEAAPKPPTKQPSSSERGDRKPGRSEPKPPVQPPPPPVQPPPEPAPPDHEAPAQE